MEEIAIGIDLGTTYTCVGVYFEDQVHIIPNEHGENYTPSYVAFVKDAPVVGAEAKEYSLIDPQNAIYGIKRIIGREYNDGYTQDDIAGWPFTVSDDNNKPVVVIKNSEGIETNYHPEEISAMVIEKMKTIVEEYTGMEVTSAVITVPAHFNNAQRQATIDAGRIAGLKELQILVEPTAAALAYSKIFPQHDGRNKRNVLVFDIGGGTFDVSVITVHGEDIQVKAVDGDSHLGGEDFDNRMVDYFVADFIQKHGRDPRGDKRAIRRLRIKCESLKKLLSECRSGRMVVDCFLDNIDYESSMTRETFELINADYFAATMKTVEAALAGADMTKNDVNEIVLVGGSTRIPKIQKMLAELFGGKELNKSIHPDEAVAHGAAIRAAQLQGNEHITKAKLSDVTPLSLGKSVIGNIFSIIIPKNTPIPVTKTTKYCTVRDRQSEFFSVIYEGENEIASENHELGRYTLKGLPLGPAGSVVNETTFSIDTNGILNISVVDRTTRQSVKLNVDYSSGRLSDDEIARVVKQAELRRDEFQKRSRKLKARANLEVYCMGIDITDTKTKIEIDQTKVWIDTTGYSATGNDYERKLRELEAEFGKLSHLPYPRIDL